MVLAAIDSIRWKPELSGFPEDARFLFVTSALGKIRGLSESELKSYFVAWSPMNPPAESNHLALDGLIKDKASKLVRTAVKQLREDHHLDTVSLPERFLVQDVHPSLGHPGATGDLHLVKPKEEMGFDNLVKFIAKPWMQYKDKPVTVQLASAFAMVDRRGTPLGCRSVIKDSVYMTYSSNPLQNQSHVNDYIQFVKNIRFQGYSKYDLVKEFSMIAGGIFHEFLYLKARQDGIEVNISSALSCRLTEHESVYGIGAAGLTPAIVGWIDKQAKLKIH